MKTDLEIQQDVLAELRWHPQLRDNDLAIGVRDGIVTLAGPISTYWGKWTAEDLTGRVAGVRAIVNDIAVVPPVGDTRSDPDIVRAVLDALRWNAVVPHERLKVRVADGWVHLEGEADWFYQAEAAEAAARVLVGVRGVINAIKVAPRPVAADVKESIARAIERAAAQDAARITVEVVAHQVTLNGKVRSFCERTDAERAARRAMGVTAVRNLLEVDPDPSPVTV